MKRAYAAAALAVVLTVNPPIVSAHFDNMQTAFMPYPIWVEPQSDDIYHIPTGLKLSQEGALRMISAADLVFVGETHSNLHAHRVQLEIIRDLNSRFPGQLSIGMEMFRTPQQESLDRWVRGELTEIEFLKDVKWYENWRSDFGYYRDILLFARDNGIDVLALNPPRELQRHMATASQSEMPRELADQLPEIDTSDTFQREVLQGVFGGHSASDKMFDAFFRVQMLWEETMADSIVNYLQGPRGHGKKMVVIAGGWHVRNGFGIPKKTIRRLPLPYTIVLPVEISLPEERKEELTMDIELPEIPLQAGDFAWMVPYEDLEGKQVRMGVQMAVSENDRVVVEKILPDSPAEKAGILPGDVFESIDGTPVGDTGDVFFSVRRRHVGDISEVVMRREDRKFVFSVTYTAIEESDPHHEKEEKR